MASWFSKQALDWFAEQHAHLPRESTVKAMFAEELVCQHCCERLPVVLFTTVDNEHFDEDGQCRKRTRQVGDVQKWIPTEAVREGYLFGIDVGLKQTQSGSAGSSTPDVGEPQPVEPAPRPVCACGQTVWDISLDYDGKPICQDCIADAAYAAYEGKSRGDIDARILAAQRSEPVRDAADWDVWSTAGDES
jgi:hypothetical protein